MKTMILLFSIFFILLSQLIFSQHSWHWAITEGGDYNEIISSICIGGDGNIYATGSFQESFDFFGVTLTSSGQQDAFIASFDTQGNLNWVRQGGGPYGDTPVDICTDGQYIYVTGGFVDQATFGETTLVSIGARDMYLLKYDLDGNLQWAISGGSVTDDIGNSITTDDAGNVYMVGDINNTATFGNKTVPYFGFTDIFLAKFDSNGGCQWANSAGSPIYDHGSCIAVKNNQLFIGGAYNDGAVFDTATISAVEFSDVYIAHYLTDGTFVEVIEAGGTNNEKIECLAVDSDLNVYVGGWYMLDFSIGNQIFNSNGDYDIFLARYEPGVGFNWAQTYGGVGSDNAFRMFCDADDHIVLTGTFEYDINFGSIDFTSEGYNDGFVGKFDSDGIFDWLYQIGGSGTLTIRGCAADTDGQYYFAGDFVEELSIGNFVFNPIAGYDMFLAQLGEGGSEIVEIKDPIVQVKTYPNPFATTTTFHYQLENPAEIKIFIYNQFGEVVDLIVSNQSAGLNNVVWTPSNLPDGIYFYKIVHKNQITTGKLTLLN